MKFKCKMLAVSLALGISAGAVAMIPNSHHTQAAIAVFDQRNIEEAIRTAIETANILTEEQKQLALMILNAKKLDENILTTWAQQNMKKRDESKHGDMIYPDSILNKSKSIEAEWNQRMGNLEDLMNGNATVWDVVLQEQKRQQLKINWNVTKI